MEATKMRKMMLAATLMFAACGAVENDMSADDGAGSDGWGSDGSGSDGSGSGSNEPSTCMTAMDCGDGRACDISTHECVTGVLTIDPTDDFVDGVNQWWTNVSDPVMRGTFEGPTNAVIQAIIGSNQGVLATLQGNTWSVKLPANSITANATTVRILMTDPSGGHTEVARQIALDTVAPVIAMSATMMHDERGDTIDFTTGEPVHTHAGPQIDLAASSCPAVYKYAYLTDAQAPSFGRQASPNPLAWNFSMQDARVITTAFRVRNATNQVILDWVTTPAPVNGAHRVELNRDGASGLAALSSYSGLLYVDVRARDWAGLETVETACIDYHPLAAPLQIEAIQQPTAQFDSMRPLSSMSLVADSPVSILTAGGFGPSVATQRVIQYTAEPIRISYRSNMTSLSFSRTYVDDYVAVSTAAGSYCQVGCYWDMPADPVDSVLSGPGTSFNHSVALIDEATNTIATDVTVIPARGPNDPPRAYRLVYYINQLADLRPSQWTYPSENTLNNLTYTGLAPTNAFSACTEVGFKFVNGEVTEVCTKMATFKRIVALDHASLEMTGVSIDLKTSPDASVAVSTPSYVPAASFVLGAVSWDSGDDDLPGAH